MICIMESTPLKILTVEEIKKKSTSEISELKKSLEEDIKNKFKYLSTVIEHGIFNKHLNDVSDKNEKKNKDNENDEDSEEDYEEHSDEEPCFTVYAMGGGEYGDSESKIFDNFEDALWCAKNYKGDWVGGNKGCTVSQVDIKYESECSREQDIWCWEAGCGETIYNYEYLTVNLLNGMINDEIENIDKIFDSIDEHVNGVKNVSK